MKNFKTFMTEKPADQDLALDNRTNMGVFSDPSVIRKLNAWVGSIADNYVLPEDAIHRLRTSLSIPVSLCLRRRRLIYLNLFISS